MIITMAADDAVT